METAELNDKPEFDIESLPVEIKLIGEMKSPWSDNPRMMDAWSVTIGKKWGNKHGEWVTTYFTGTGLRDKRTGRPKRPKMIDVLYALFTDASAADENFSEWCENYGYSDDSIKALNVYKACAETAINLRRQFDSETRAKIRAVIQEV
jgi:hypothetical protein